MRGEMIHINCLPRFAESGRIFVANACSTDGATARRAEAEMADEAQTPSYLLALCAKKDLKHPLKSWPARSADRFSLALKKSIESCKNLAELFMVVVAFLQAVFAPICTSRLATHLYRQFVPPESHSLIQDKPKPQERNESGDKNRRRRELSGEERVAFCVGSWRQVWLLADEGGPRE